MSGEIIRLEGDVTSVLVAEALSELARLALEGSSRVELAACATKWLGRMVPGCRAVVVEAVEGGDEAAVLCDTGASGRHINARFSFNERSAFAQAHREPLKVFHATGAALADSVTGYPADHAGQYVLVCAGLMGKSGGRVVLAALMDQRKREHAGDLDAPLLMLASQLAVAFSVSRSRTAAIRANDGILRAKMEWERTVDALADIVCLLDADGRIVRANRVVEQWGLGRVSELVGKPAHEMFHPGCSRSRCSLGCALTTASQELLRGKPTRFDCREDELDRNLLFDIRPMLPGAASPSSPCEVRAVLVVADVSELRHARDALNELNASLETKVRTRTQELREANRGLRNEVVRRKAAEAALLASNSERALLSEQLIVAQENERHRIARELHDAAGQSLSAVKYLIEQAIEMLHRPGLGDPLPALSQAVRSTLDATESIRTIATSLRPSILDDMGPASAVAGFCRHFAEVYRGIDVDIQVSATDEDVPDRLATALFRSAQELLNNVAKHAQATRVRIVLRREPLLLLLEVTDDGVGIVDSRFTASPLHGHGIRNLRERSQLSGGTFELTNGAAGGTVARLSWPLLHDEVPERDEL